MYALIQQRVKSTRTVRTKKKPHVPGGLKESREAKSDRMTGEGRLWEDIKRIDIKVDPASETTQEKQFNRDCELIINQAKEWLAEYGELEETYRIHVIEDEAFAQCRTRTQVVDLERKQPTDVTTPAGNDEDWEDDPEDM